MSCPKDIRLRYIEGCVSNELPEMPSPALNMPEGRPLFPTCSVHIQSRLEIQPSSQRFRVLLVST